MMDPDHLGYLLDRYLPGIPGVSATSSKRGFERARALGVEGSYTLIRGGLHGVAVRAPGAKLIPLLRAEEANLRYARQLAQAHGWWRQVISTMQGLRILYDYTGRGAEWATG